jgi:Mce-associated membrane protein
VTVTDSDKGVPADTGSDHDTAAPAPADPPKPAPARRLRRAVAAGALAMLLVVAATLSVWLYFAQYRPDQRSQGEAQAVTTAASDGAVAVLTYSADTVDRDLAAAKTHLTGQFLSYYDNFTTAFVAPAAKQKGLKTSAEVTSSAVSELHPDSATVLIFVNQTTTSTDKPDPASAASSVLVKLTKVNGHWLISSFDPV